MKQQCYLLSLYGSYAVLLALAAWGGWIAGWIGAAAAALLGGVALWAYVRSFARWSRLLGYGSVEDRAGPSPRALPTAAVTLYTATGCPFCPIVERRLRSISQRRGFPLRRVDVTLRPDILVRRKVYATPVVEREDGRLLVGNATTDELEAFLGVAST